MMLIHKSMIRYILGSTKKMRKQKYKEQECRRRYYFFDYLFWLGEITWENYHKVNFKQPRGSDMLWACITFGSTVISVN